MSTLSNITKIVWRVRILRIDKYGEAEPITDWQEFDTEESATIEGLSQVEYWIEQTSLHHEAIFDKRVVPLYI